MWGVWYRVPIVTNSVTFSIRTEICTKYLGASWLPCLLSRIMVLGSPRIYDHSNHGFLVKYSTLGKPFTEWTLSLIRELFLVIFKMTIVPLDTFYWASNYCNAQDLQLSRPIDNFSLLAAYIAPPNSIRAIQGRGCQVSTSSISSSP